MNLPYANTWRVAKIVFACVLLVAGDRLANADTLGEVLSKTVPDAATPPADTGQAITSYATLNDSSDFGIAYFAVDAHQPELLQPPLRLLMLHKSSGAWKHREFGDIQTNMRGFESSCLGSVLDLERSGNWLLMVTHLTPSAGCTAILTSDLRLVRTLYGWPTASFSSGALILQKSEIHFASTHPLELILYDPAANHETQLLPLHTDDIWKDLIQDIEATQDRQWCREHNASCDPERMDGTLESIVVNNETRAAALRVVYDSLGFGPKTEDYVGDATVIYLFEFASPQMHHREFREDVLKRTFGTSDLNEIVKVALLRKIFAKAK